MSTTGFVLLSPFLFMVGAIALVFSIYIVSEIKDEKKLESDCVKNHVDIKRIFSRMIERLRLLENQSVEMENLKSKIKRLDVFVERLNNEELSRFEAHCIDEMSALLKIQKTMLTSKFNVKNKTLMDLINLVINNLISYREEFEKIENIDLRCELESLKNIKAKRERLIEYPNKF